MAHDMYVCMQICVYEKFDIWVYLLLYSISLNILIMKTAS